MYWEETRSKSPVTAHIDRKNGVWKTYSKELWEEVEVKVDKLVLLDQLSTIRGRHDASQSGIYSNQVHKTTEEDLVVKAFNYSGPLLEGKYAEIKDKIKAAGGVFTKWLICLLDGEMVELYIKGAALKEFNDFFEKFSGNKYIELGDPVEKSKGTINYKVPSFKEGKAVSEKDDKLAKEMVETLKNYFNPNKD